MKKSNEDLTREEWVIAKTVINAIMVFNSLYCARGKEMEKSEKNICKILDYISKYTSLVAIEDIKIAIDRIYQNKKNNIKD